MHKIALSSQIDPPASSPILSGRAPSARSEKRPLFLFNLAQNHRFSTIVNFCNCLNLEKILA